MKYLTLTQSATFKLTTWYLLLLVVICLVFNVAIYGAATSDMADIAFVDQTHTEYVVTNLDAVKEHTLQTMLRLNIIILIIGSVVCYFRARRALKPIEEAQRNQIDFISNASHELNTPLATLRAEIEFILTDPKATKSDLKEVLQSNLEEVISLSTLTSILLKLSHAQSIKVDFEAVDLYKAFVMRKDKLRYRRIVLKGKPGCIANVNRALFRDIARILLNNAHKYSPPDSKIVLEIARKGRFVTVSFTNEGEGIKKEDLPHVFDRFYRSDTAHSSNGKIEGYGLGLSIAKQMAELMRGQISVKSVPNKYTTFTVQIPAARARRQSLLQ